MNLVEKIIIFEDKKCKVVAIEGGNIIIDCGDDKKIELGPQAIKMLSGISDLGQEKEKEKGKEQEQF